MHFTWLIVVVVVGCMYSVFSVVLLKNYETKKNLKWVKNKKDGEKWLTTPKNIQINNRNRVTNKNFQIFSLFFSSISMMISVVGFFGILKTALNVINKNRRYYVGKRKRKKEMKPIC